MERKDSVPTFGELTDKETPPSNRTASLLSAKEDAPRVGSGSSEENRAVST